MKNDNQDLDDGLTAEERAALSDDGDIISTNDKWVTDDKATAAGQEAAKPDADPEAAAEAAAAAEASAAEQPAAAAEQPAAQNGAEGQPQPAPILVAPPTDEAVEKLTEIGTKKDELLEQFDNGDITAKEYQKQLDALSKEERKIEFEIHEANLAQKMEQQRMQNEWQSTCNSFVDSHPIYKNNTRLYQALDAEVRDLASKPETANWTGQKFLDEAHKNLKAAFGFVEPNAPEGGKQQSQQQRELPPNLAKVPASEVQDTNGGRFAVLDRLATTDPIAYEETLAKMPAAERDAYLAAG